MSEGEISVGWFVLDVSERLNVSMFGRVLF